MYGMCVSENCGVLLVKSSNGIIGTDYYLFISLTSVFKKTEFYLSLCMLLMMLGLFYCSFLSSTLPKDD